MATNKMLSIYDEKYMSEDDKRLVTDIKNRATAGQTDWKSAHELVEKTRAKYGYSGGDDGSRYIRIDGGTPDSFGVSAVKEYVSPYSDNIEKLTSAVLANDTFTYDPEKDPTYKQLEKSYTKNAQKAMDDTLGKVSARTGGIASSYAGLVAQDTYNDYMDDLSDKIPELREAQYQRQQQEKNNNLARLNALMSLDSAEYNKFVNSENLARSDRNFNYGVSRDKITDEQNDETKKLNDALLRAEYGDLSGLEALGVDTSTYKAERDHNNKLSDAVLRAEYGDLSGIEALGVDTSAYKADSEYTKAVNDAVLRAEYGDLSGLEALGIDTSAYKNSLVNSSIVDVPQNVPSLSFTEAKKAAENGIFDATVITVLRENGYTDQMLRAYYNYPEVLTDSLGVWAKNALSHIRDENGNVHGITEAQAENLKKRYQDGFITEEEINAILTILGIV